MRKQLTFANITSFLALFVALSAGAYAATSLPANSVGSKQLKTNAVTTSKLAAHAVTRNKLAANAVDGSKVAPGSLTGADINLATLGKVPSAAVADSASVARVNVATASSAAAPDAPGGTGATASCAPGLTVVGGGASLSDESNETVIDSYPSSSTGWTVHVVAGSSGGTAFTVYAICVPAASNS